MELRYYIQSLRNNAHRLNDVNVVKMCSEWDGWFLKNFPKSRKRVNIQNLHPLTTRYYKEFRNYSLIVERLDDMFTWFIFISLLFYIPMIIFYLYWVLTDIPDNVWFQLQSFMRLLLHFCSIYVITLMPALVNEEVGVLIKNQFSEYFHFAP